MSVMMFSIKNSTDEGVFYRCKCKGDLVQGKDANWFFHKSVNNGLFFGLACITLVPKRSEPLGRVLAKNAAI